MPKSTSSLALGPYRADIQRKLEATETSGLTERLWARDHRLWKPQPVEIENRLGWLTVSEHMQERIGELESFAEGIQQAGFRHVVLLGMGGSSLGPEVLSQTFHSARGYPKLMVLDSTVPGAVRAVAAAIDPAKTLFLLSSKSGGTIEVLSLFAYFWEAVRKAKGNQGGKQFIAITDPQTSLAALAQERGFRTTFINPSDIGGRYSVLSYFGLVPAALMGLQVETLLARAIAMARFCGPKVPPRENPGAVLGVAMGVLNGLGRDKVTVLASPRIASFGLWVEQLLAESTGKEGKGLIPVAQEPVLPVNAYDSDRFFVYLRMDGDRNDRLDTLTAALPKAGHPVVHLRLREPYDLAAEFFRWEFATAVAGHFLKIHPFDQPNVQESKDNTKRLLDMLEKGRGLPSVDVDDHLTLENALADMSPGAYVAILAYVAPSPKVEAAVRGLRKRIATRYRVATTAGYGPRYLHSTGQLHKGGPSNALFVELVDRMVPDAKIPGARYTFRELARAQAIGDLQSLQSHSRRVVHVSLGRDPAGDIGSLLMPSSTAAGGRRRPRPQHG